MLVDQFTFRRQLRQFRILTVIGYVMLLLVVVGMVVTGPALEGIAQSIPVAVPVGLVGVVLFDGWYVGAGVADIPRSFGGEVRQGRDGSLRQWLRNRRGTA